MQIWLKNHNFCDIFYTSQKCSFIPPLPGFHKIRDITKLLKSITGGLGLFHNIDFFHQLIEIRHGQALHTVAPGA